MGRRSRSTGALSWGGFLLRLTAALALVFATYNPEHRSYYHWVTGSMPAFTALQAVAGVGLVIGYAIFVRATLRSLGTVGLVLAVAFFGTILWLLIEQNLVATDNIRTVTYIVLIMIGAVMGVGMSWSFIRRRLTGQLDVDDVD